MGLVNGTVVRAMDSMYGGYEILIHLDDPNMIEELKTGQHVGIVDILEGEAE